MAIYNALPPPAPYTLGERLLRTIYYETSVIHGIFERCVIWLYKLFANHEYGPVLDEARETRGLLSLQRLGAEISFVIPRDGLAHIQMMSLSSSTFKSKIETLGGRWEKLHGEGSMPSLLAIIPPRTLTAEWLNFEKDCLRLKWSKEEVMIAGQKQEVIITCPNADNIKESDYHTKLFLHANSASVTFSMLTRRWGFYLGCMQSIVAYNPRGCAASTGVASEAGHYNDIQAVYDKVKNSHDPNHIWLSSACGGGPAAAYLTAHNNELKNWLFENGFTRLSDCILLQSPTAQRFARRWMRGLHSLDIPPEQRPEEFEYDSEQLLANTTRREGTMIVARVINDHVLPPHIHERNKVLATKIYSHVKEVLFASTRADGNHHIDRFFCHKEAAYEVTKALFLK